MCIIIENAKINIIKQIYAKNSRQRISLKIICDAHKERKKKHVQRK